MIRHMPSEDGTMTFTIMTPVTRVDWEVMGYVVWTPNGHTLKYVDGQELSQRNAAELAYTIVTDNCGSVAAVNVDTGCAQKIVDLRKLADDDPDGERAYQKFLDEVMNNQNED